LDYLISDIWDYLNYAIAGAVEYKAMSIFIAMICLLIVLLPGKNTIRERIITAILLIFLYLVFSANVMARPVTGGQHVNLNLLDPYQLLLQGSWSMIPEICENLILFLPSGICMGLLSTKQEHGAALAVLFLFLFSTAVEVSQALLRVGILETADIIHNTLGGAVGVLVGRWIVILKRKLVERG